MKNPDYTELYIIPIFTRKALFYKVSDNKKRINIQKIRGKIKKEKKISPLKEYVNLIVFYPLIYYYQYL